MQQNVQDDTQLNARKQSELQQNSVLLQTSSPDIMPRSIKRF